MKTFVLGTVFILCSLQYIMCKEGVAYKFVRNACKPFNPKYVYNTSCRVKSFNRTTTLINTKVFFQPNIKLTDIRLEFTTNIRFGTVYRPSLIIKHSEYVCDALDMDNGKFSHFFSRLRESYANTSNALTPCPKSGLLYLNNTIINTSTFPQFVPVGEYRVDTKVLTSMNGKEEFVMLYQSYLEVKPLGAQQF